MNPGQKSDASTGENSFAARLARRVLEGFVAVILFAMMVLVFVDVIARYLFNAPLAGGFELTELMMGALIFAALPLATLREEHIVIGLLDELPGEGAHRIRRALLNLVAAAALGVLASRLWAEAGKLAEWGDYTAYLNIPLAPVVYLFAVMSAVAAAILVATAWRYGAGGRRRGGQGRSDF